jgi:DNA-repair protein complementing XP-A cells
MVLTPEQQAKVDQNRRNALERLKQRGVLTGHNNNRVTKPSDIPSNSKTNIYSINLTEEQRRKIEANRQKALEKLKEKQNNFRNASTNENAALPIAGSSKSIRPSVRQHEYIDYDLSTMKDTNGGFIDLQNGASGNQPEKTLDDWKAEQRIVRDLPPPADMENAIKCYECNTFEINQKLWDVFKCRVCRRCEKNNPNKYSLLTKTECREDYFLTEPELQDVGILARMEKPNPHGTYSRMQLFLRYQVEEFAFKKWGGPEGLDQEWVRREEGKVKRRDKKYEDKMKEMRKKTRAEEYNRKLREGKFDDHTHSWSNYFDGGENEDGMALKKRRCLHCGFETEEIVI